MGKFSITLWFVLLLQAGSCGGNDLSRSQTLGKLKVLVVVADKPELQPGGSVQISPVVSFADKGNSSLTQEAWGCLDPGVAAGAVPTCDYSLDRVSLMDQTSLALTGPNYTESLDNLFSFSIPASMLTPYDSVTRYNGIAYLVEYIVRSSDGQVVRSIKRINVSDKSLAEWNTNPTLSNILQSDGQVFATLPRATISLFPNFPGASRQAYTSRNSAGALQSANEGLAATWFVSRGSFEFDRTDSAGTNSYTPNGAGPTGSPVMVVVLRDNRGGLAVKIVNF